MCSPASAILASIATILVSFEAILKRISVNINIRSQFQGNFPTISFKIDQNCFKIYKYCDNTCKYYTCRWTHFASIDSVLNCKIIIILASIEQVNTPKDSSLNWSATKNIAILIQMIKLHHQQSNMVLSVAHNLPSNHNFSIGLIFPILVVFSVE